MCEIDYTEADPLCVAFHTHDLEGTLFIGLSEEVGNLPKKVSKETEKYLQGPSEGSRQQMLCVWMVCGGFLERIGYEPDLSRTRGEQRVRHCR